VFVFVDFTATLTDTITVRARLASEIFLNSLQKKFSAQIGI
jgi:hypothetical protein